MSELPLILTIIVLSFLQQIYRSQAIAGAAASAAANQGQQQSIALLQQQQQHFVQQQLAGERFKTEIFTVILKGQLVSCHLR